MLSFDTPWVTRHKITVLEGNPKVVANFFSQGIPRFEELLPAPTGLTSTSSHRYDVGMRAMYGDWQRAAHGVKAPAFDPRAKPDLFFPSRQRLLRYLRRRHPDVLEAAKQQLANRHRFGFDTRDEWSQFNRGYARIRGVRDAWRQHGPFVFETCLGYAQPAYEALTKAQPQIVARIEVTGDNCKAKVFLIGNGQLSVAKENSA